MTPHTAPEPSKEVDMEIPYFQVDAFTDRIFGGNPAGVCPLHEWLDDDVLQAIATENNLSETAFFVKAADSYHLRWFTPVSEVDLCGHATLGTAHVLFRHLGHEGDTVRFTTRSGVLVVRQAGPRLEMDFPSRPGEPVDPPADLIAGLGIQPVKVFRSRDYMAIYEREEQIHSLRPDHNRLVNLECTGIIVTAPGEAVDFVSRFFAPAEGIPEDPVTGSAHCTLIPYWADRLGRTTLHARQVSARGGELFCRLQGDRVSIAGQAVTFMTGSIEI